MATLYNKTALKKIKKDELIQMFLDKQARVNSYEIGLNGVCDACKTLQEENEKLKEKLLSKSEELSNIRREKLELEDILFEHIKKGTIKYQQKFL